MGRTKTCARQRTVRVIRSRFTGAERPRAFPLLRRLIWAALSFLWSPTLSAARVRNQYILSMLFIVFLKVKPAPPSSRHHLSYDDCLEVEEKLSELFGAALHTTVVHSDMQQFLKMSVGLGLFLVFVHLFRFSILCVFSWYSLGHFVLVLFAFVVFRSSFFSAMPRDWLGRTSLK